MSNILAIFASLIMGIQSAFTPQAAINSKKPTTKEPVKICLNEVLAKNGTDPGDLKVPKVLKNIKKTSKGNTTQGYEIPECLNKGACDGPETANYKLIATNIQLDHTVFPNSFIDGEKLSDRQMVKQFDFTDDRILADRYMSRIYRTFCGDWCYTCKPADVKCLDPQCLKVECDTTNPPWVLPYQGSYHCNFIFYLQDKDINGNLQVDQYGNPAPGILNDLDPNVPKDNTLYSVYFREGGTLPPDIKCDNSVKEDTIIPTPDTKPINTLIEYPKNSERFWRLVKNTDNNDGLFTARNSEIINYQIKSTLNNPADLSGTFDLVQNLVDPESANILYLITHESILDIINSLESNPPVIKLFSYYKLNRWNDSASQKSLKLGTFPFKMDWVKDWVRESKPAIYLYPEKITAVNVKLNPMGYLTVSDPPYNSLYGWNIIAHPDGTIQQFNNVIINQPIYPYLYYEANLSEKPDPEVGFVIEKSKLSGFFDNTLPTAGLNNKELMDFKEYWLPRLNEKEAKYYLIYFLSPEEIERIEPINITIPLDTSIRVRLYFKPLNSYVNMPQQLLTPAPARSGNTMVEWGGILDNN